MSQIILCEELAPIEAKVLNESSKDGKSMWISGICMQSTIKNRNGRIYPLHEISNAVKNASQQIKENNGIFGELDHPQTLSINSDRISHVITEMWMHGNDAYGKARLLNTPMGLIGQELLKSGVKIGVSSRGAGTVNESGDVQNYQFSTYDLVISPSAFGAIAGVMYESVMNQTNRKVMTLAEAAQHDPAAQKYLKEEILKWVSSCKFK